MCSPLPSTIGGLCPCIFVLHNYPALFAITLHNYPALEEIKSEKSSILGMGIFGNMPLLKFLDAGFFISPISFSLTRGPV